MGKLGKTMTVIGGILLPINLFVPTSTPEIGLFWSAISAIVLGVGVFLWRREQRQKNQVSA